MGSICNFGHIPNPFIVECTSSSLFSEGISDVSELMSPIFMHVCIDGDLD
jgi:hypothetical protein